MALKYRAVHLGGAHGGPSVPITRALGTLAYAESDLQYLKRRGLTAWVEDEKGQFVPVPGAKTARLRNVAESAWARIGGPAPAKR
jgi:hypothetical protein